MMYLIKEALGKFKDEMNGKPIRECIALRPKMYAIKVQETDQDKEYKRAKGIPKHIVKNELNFKAYTQTFEENSKSRVNFNCIRSSKHQLYSINCSKSGLSNFENKRYYISNNHSLPYGHYAIN